MSEQDIIRSENNIEIVGTAEERASLFKKLSKVNSSVKRIKHTGYFSGGYSGEYTYATEADVVEPIAAALAKQSVALIPGIEGVMWHDMPGKNGSQRLCTIMATMIIGDGDTGAYIKTSAASTAANKDKATNSAFTTATKYFMAKLGNVAFGDDADEYDIEGNNKASSKVSKKKIDDLGKKIGQLPDGDETKAAVKKYVSDNGISWTKLTEDQYKAIIGMIE